MSSRRLFLRIAFIFNAVFFLLLFSPVRAGEETGSGLNSVVRIETTFFEFSYDTPWKQPSLHSASGTGFIIQGNRILTNAHVISQSNTIRIQRPDQRKDYEARVVFVAHDCDLALLSVDDPSFFQGAQPLELGQIPELNSPVIVIGFPIGGDRVSITRGIVSRKEMDLYSHSEIDYHLVIQVDAAINPGNSGGPALQNGKVIGVAFQVLTRGENVGYLIPTVVVRRFLRDIEDGRYDGYIDFGTLEIFTENPVLRNALGLSSLEGDTGVFIYTVFPGSSADGFLKPGDVLLSVNAMPLTEKGDVEVDGSLQSYSELIDNISPGTPINVEIWRDGKKMQLTFPARKTNVFEFQRRNYDSPPAYLICAGLVFQPVDANLMETMGAGWAAAGKMDILYRYRYFIYNAIYKETAVDVVLTRKLNDAVNLYAGRFIGSTVESVNGNPVRDFNAFISLMDEAQKAGRFVIVRFRNDPVPLILRSEVIASSSSGILEKYGIVRDRMPVRRLP